MNQDKRILSKTQYDGTLISQILILKYSLLFQKENMMVQK